MDWQPIETAPKDGTPVDLWVVGRDDTVDFYCPNAKKVKGKPFRHGRTTDWVWKQVAPNAPKWHQSSGLGMPLSPEVYPTHWMPLPPPPHSEETCPGHVASEKDAKVCGRCGVHIDSLRADLPTGGENE